MALIDRVASTDSGYKVGDLSLYPKVVDDQFQLYTVVNNATTVTAQSASYNATYFIVDSTDGFPAQGIILVGTEAVYYEQLTSNSFRSLKRGFAGSVRSQWSIGTKVSAIVFAEAHNAIKDALINVETNLGTEVDPDENSLNGILSLLETRFLAPKPVFQSMVTVGTAPLFVAFQNFSACDVLSCFWDFGDGGTSVQKQPIHKYNKEGQYTIALTIITKLGGQGVSTKSNYITISSLYSAAFFYVTSYTGSTSTVFEFVDQTDGLITARYWQWGDGGSLEVLDPNQHTATHTYAQKGTYSPSLLVVFADNNKKIVKANQPIVII